MGLSDPLPLETPDYERSKRANQTKNTLQLMEFMDIDQKKGGFSSRCDSASYILHNNRTLGHDKQTRRLLSIFEYILSTGSEWIIGSRKIALVELANFVRAERTDNGMGNSTIME